MSRLWMLSAIPFVIGLVGCFSATESGESSAWNTNVVVSATMNSGLRDGSPFLTATIRAVNIGQDTLAGVATYEGCEWLLRIYDNAEYAGVPIWRVEDAGMFCRAMNNPVSLAPSEEFVTNAQGAFVAAILGTREPGTYYVTAILRLAESGVETREFPLGPVELSP
ncbi:MAG: hypothetical protein WD043_02695 [Gemmatimonadales bacterium]